MTQEKFAADQMIIDATERCLSRIGEAAVKLGPDAETLAPGIPWPDIRGLGNHLRHRYRGVRNSDIWAIISENLPPLRHECVSAQERLREKK